MKKIAHIEIQDTHFPIEHNAYTVLKKYLASLHAHFSSFDEASEIIDDLESRIAEKFSTEILSKRHKTITLSDVNKVISSIGKIEDMEADTKDEYQKKTLFNHNETTKKYYRSTDDALLGGVASGVAHYFDWDVTLVRLLFLASIMLGGYTVLLYIVVWIITPEAKTTTEKMQQRGDAITIASLEKNVKKELEKMPERAESLKQTTNSFFKKQSWLKSFLLLGVKTIGFILFISMIIALITIFFTLTFAFFNINHPYLDPAIGEIVSTFSEPWLMPTLFSSVLLITAIPLYIVMLLGYGLMQLRKPFGLGTIISTLTLWLSSIGVMAALAIMYMPQVESKQLEIFERRQKSMASTQVTKEFEFKDFNSLELNNYTHVVLQQGPYRIKVSGDNEIVNAVEVSQKGELILVNNEQPVISAAQNCWIGCFTKSALVEIWMPEIKNIQTKDSSRLMKSTDTAFVSSNPISIIPEDHSYIELVLETPSLLLNSSNYSSVMLSGKTNSLEITAKDDTHINLRDLLSKNAQVTSENSANVSLNVSDLLRGFASDTSSIKYYGNPKVEAKENDNGAILELENESY